MATKACFSTGLIAASLLLVLGCDNGGGNTVTISYARPAEMEVPPKIKNLAVNEFDGDDSSSKQWGQVASDKICTSMEQANIKSGRYKLVDRRGLKKILDERDLQTAFGNPQSAAKHAGKLNSVDAIIYGNVKVSAEEKDATRTSFSISSQRPETVHYTKLYCQVIVSFTMVDVATGATLATMSTTENYDSDKDGGKKSPLAMIAGSGGLKPSDEVLAMLIDRTVAKFVAKVSPHEENFVEKLAGGKSKSVKTGNTLAVSGDFEAALEQYLKASQERPDDDGALFNAGLMHERTGQFAKALKCYEGAFALKNEAKYAQARMRVRP